jgi:AAA+ ATPase superfamily predicted ATPase
MHQRNYFPLGKAYGEAFCNREEEIAWLIGNLENAKHSLLIAPRRYGKSSLAEKAVEKTSLPFVKANFHLCTTEEEVADLIMSSVVKLIGKSIGPVEKVINSIKKYASNVNPKITFGDDIATLELVPKMKSNQAVILSESLLMMEKLLREKKKRAVLFLDEFQEISKIKKSSAIEGAIRTAAQEMQHLSIIFSGSIRSLLLSMFEDENRPLYKLCRKLKLERISAEAYQKHINKIAKKTWGEMLSENVFNRIMTLSNRHPYYVNYLCDVLWQKSKASPLEKDVQEAWKIVLEEEWSDTLREISVLPLSQRKILKYIANHDIDNLMGQEVYHALAIPASTAASAVNSLVEKDYLEMEADGKFKIINPLLLTVFTGENLEG